jgi:Fe2+ transport system protein FeoA
LQLVFPNEIFLINLFMYMEFKALTEAPNEIELKIIEIKSDLEVKHRLNNLGLHILDSIKLIKSNNWGPVLVQNLSYNDSRIAIGRGLAEKIIVEY